MYTYAHRTSATLLILALILFQGIPGGVAIADETTSDSSSSSSQEESTSSESESSSSSESSSESTNEDSSSSESSESDHASTSTHDNLYVNATSSESEDIGHDIEEVIGEVSSSTSGFVDVFASTSTSTIPEEEDIASTTDDIASSTPDDIASSTPEVEATGENLASTTGELIASSTQTIISGGAVAVANILNLLNTSFLNSAGLILFGNFINEAGTIDLRDGSLFGACGEEGCAGLQGVQLNLLQDAYILNNILMSANSGQNALGNASSSAAILTGDAFAGLNLVNLANVTFANSTYMLATLNAFQGVDGDIVFPSLYDFFSSLTTAVDPDSISLVNDAEVNNNVTAEAESGDNTTQNVDGPAFIQTGSSEARANVFNQINSLLAGEGVAILLRISGDFNGEVWGLPDNVTVVQTPMGLYISGRGTGEPQAINGLGVAGTSTAGIDNNVQMQARTGENLIENASSTALISTGNAFAGANIINIANQTVIGRNWMLAVFNIFGDLNGNIAFGRPDLWVGARADAPAQLGDGSDVHYTITVKNRGDSVAHDVFLTETWDPEHLSILDSSVEYVLDRNTMRFSLGTLDPGENLEVSYTAEIHDTPQGTEISSLSSAASHETDNDVEDNTDGTTIRTHSGGGGGSAFLSTTAAASLAGGASSNTGPTNVILDRVSDAMQASALSPHVRETLILKNAGTAVAHDVVLKDVLRDPSGNVLHTEEWVIREIAAKEELLITYEFTFAPEAPLGRYTLTTELTGANIESKSAVDGWIDIVAPEIPIIAQPPQVAAEEIVGEVLESLRRAPLNIPVQPFAPDTQDVGAMGPEALVAAAGTIDTDESRFYVAMVGLFLLLALLYRGLRFYV